MTHPLRKWQALAIPQFVNGALRGLKDQLAYVTPGGGKTRFAVEVAKQLIESGEVRRVVVVVHTHNLREQWIRSAGELGLVLSDVVERSKSNDGFVVTYQQLVDDLIRSKVKKVSSGKRQTLVIPDECHHMAEGKNWGDNCEDAFGKCHRRILLSGTPVRADDCRIPFVTYRNNIAVADFIYGYSDALSDGVVPPVFFPTFGGSATWKVGDDEFKSTSDGMTAADQTRRLNTMIQSPGWIADAFKAADRQLGTLRKHHPDAGGLIVCKDQNHARMVEAAAKRFCKSVSLAVSDARDAHKTIDSFRDGSDRWLVTVRMVSEGIDIPRLRVGLYATNYRAELFFRQVVGRFVRIIRGLPEQSAFIYLPDHPDLARFALEMSIDRTHVLKGSEGVQRNPSRLNGSQGGFVAGDAKFELGGVYMPGSEFTSEELEEAEAARHRVGLGYLPVEVYAKILRDAKDFRNG